MTRRAAVALTLLATVATGCEFIRDPEPLGPTAEHATVHAILRTGSDTAAVFINRPESDAGERFSVGVERVTGAAVRLGQAGDGLTALPEAPAGFPACFTERVRHESRGPDGSAGPGCYAALLSAPVRAGERYRLEVTLPDGAAVTGELVAPAPPAVSAPAGHRTLAYAPPGSPGDGPQVVRVRWDAAPGSLVQVDIAGGLAWRGDEPLVDVRCPIRPGFRTRGRFYLGGTVFFDATDSVEVVVNDPYCFAPDDADGSTPVEVEDWDSVTTRVVVAAYDTAYARYLRTVAGAEGTVRGSTAAVGMSGAPGVFAAYASVERAITMVRTTASSAVAVASGEARAALASFGPSAAPATSAPSIRLSDHVPPDRRAARSP